MREPPETGTARHGRVEASRRQAAFGGPKLVSTWLRPLMSMSGRFITTRRLLSCSAGRRCLIKGRPRLRSAAFFALVVARPARASCWGEHIGGSAGVQGNGVPAGGARLGRVRARRAGPRGAAMPQSQPWQALAFCWPSSTGQGCAKVSDHRFMDSKLINYVPYVPIDHARAGYEVYAQISMPKFNCTARSKS